MPQRRQTFVSYRCDDERRVFKCLVQNLAKKRVRFLHPEEFSAHVDHVVKALARLLTVQPFDTEEEAIALANSTPYGLAACLQTGNIARAHRVSAALDAGIVWVNAWALLDPAVPFGGVKASGWGREYGPESLEAYTRTKSVVISTQG